MTDWSWDRILPSYSLKLDSVVSLLGTTWKWTLEDISVIRLALPGELPAHALAGLLIGENEYTIVYSEIHKDKEFMASVLAHEGWHAKQHIQGRKYYGSHAERECISLQALVLTSIMPSHKFIGWLWEQSSKQLDNGPLAGNPKMEE